MSKFQNISGKTNCLKFERCKEKGIDENGSTEEQYYLRKKLQSSYDSTLLFLAQQIKTN